jgi:feruloyl esterase
MKKGKTIMKKKMVTLTALTLLLSLFLLATTASADLLECEDLASLEIRNTTITGTTYVPPAGELPGYCEVMATVAPQTDVAVRLPDNWFGRYLHLGGGGFDGEIPDLNETVPPTGKNPLEDGFIIVASNGGHRAEDYPAASFSADRGLTLGYATGAIYDSDVVGTALVEAYYGEPAQYNYFIGCSNGGKNGTHAAGTFSNFYDGVIAASGAYGHCTDNMNGTSMSELTAKWVQVAETVPISEDKGQAVLNAQLAKCDAMDGLEDGIIGDPDACDFNPAELRCSESNASSCLTDAEIEAINIIRSDLKDANGRVIGAPYALADPSLVRGFAAILGGGFLSMSFGTGEPISDTSTFDLEQDFSTVKTVLDDIYSMTASLSRMSDYLRNNGKLFLWHGWEDMVVMPYVSTRAYHALKKNAGLKGRRNVRLYMLPGVGHCRGGAGADTVDLLGAMTLWVEAGIPPNYRLIASKISPDGVTEFTRPLCEYPEIPVYRRGDPDAADSFRCRFRKFGRGRHD